MEPSAVASPPQRASFSRSFHLRHRRLDIGVTFDERTARDFRTVALIGRYPRTIRWLSACVIIFLVWQRCPSIISHAAFWGEDGWVWYPQCYASGWQCLLIDHSGYLQTISRLVALLSLLWPLAAAPKVFAMSALFVQAAPAIFLLSPRMAPAIPSLGLRMALALLLVAIPGMDEVYVNLTNAQWHLALLAFLVLTAAPPATAPQRGFDTLVLFVSGLSGPFAPLLLPVALIWWWRQRGRWQLWRLAIIGVCAVGQAVLVLLHQSSRHVAGPGIGATLGRLINIVDTDILAVAAFGRQGVIDRFWLVGEGWLTRAQPLPMVIAGCIMAGALALAVIAFWRGPWILRAFIIFVGLELVSSLIDGLSLTQPLWVAMEHWVGMRYYFHPIAAWLAILVALICDRCLPLRAVGVAVMMLTVIFGIPADWELPALPRSTFVQEAKEFAKAPPGTVMSFPIRRPPAMVLVKR
jgi:hypothetical protein